MTWIIVAKQWKSAVNPTAIVTDILIPILYLFLVFVVIIFPWHCFRHLKASGGYRLSPRGFPSHKARPFSGTKTPSKLLS